MSYLPRINGTKERKEAAGASSLNFGLRLETSPDSEKGLHFSESANSEGAA